jgi:hypothetical protein
MVSASVACLPFGLAMLRDCHLVLALGGGRLLLDGWWVCVYLAGVGELVSEECSQSVSWIASRRPSHFGPTMRHDGRGRE